MKYTVVWGKDAEQDLASIWLASQDRDQVTYAAHLLDEMLAESADRAGESREGAVRIAFAAPLAVEFEVLPADRLAHVLAVWRF